MTSSSLDNFIRRKKESKHLLSEKFSFSARRPLLGIILDKELSANDEALLGMMLEATTHVGVQVVVLADTNLEVFSAAHALVLPYSRGERETLLQACDMALSFDFNDVEEMLLNGTVPISCNRPEILDYNPNHEIGNGFVFGRQDHWCMFAALIRALETFKFPYDWRNIVRQGVEMMGK